MNWKLIFEKYPRAFHMFITPFLSDFLVEHYSKCGVLDGQKVGKPGIYFFGEPETKTLIPFIKHRGLFEFFDLNKVFIHNGPLNGNIIQTTDEGQLMKDVNIGPFKTRKQTEIEAFTKAFEMLENKLLINNHLTLVK